jgi:hypothetical protein
LVCHFPAHADLLSWSLLLVGYSLYRSQPSFGKTYAAADQIQCAQHRALYLQNHGAIHRWNTLNASAFMVKISKN